MPRPPFYLPSCPPYRLARSAICSVILSAILSTGLVCSTPGPAHADPLSDFGTAMKYGLPAAAAICAHRQDRLEDFAIRGALQTLLVWGLKEVFADSPLGRRPSGQGQGFPSGHTAMAFFGAGDLAGKCFHDQPEAGLASYGLAGLAGYSRINGGQHNAAQVMTGALIGLSFGAASFGIGPDGAGFSFGMRF